MNFLSNEKKRSDIPKHCFLLGYGEDDGLPVVGNLQRNNKFMFLSPQESLLFTAINESVNRNKKQIGFVIVTNRVDYWMDIDLPNTYIYSPNELGEILDKMEDEIELTDDHDVVLVVDGIKFDKNCLKRLFNLRMFALFWWTDQKEISEKINKEYPDLQYKYKVIYADGGKCAVRKSSNWLYFTLA